MYLYKEKRINESNFVPLEVVDPLKIYIDNLDIEYEG